MLSRFRYAAVAVLFLVGGGCVNSNPIDRAPAGEVPPVYRENVFGYITMITTDRNSRGTVSIQPALWLTGIEAQMMAMEDGACDEPEDCTPNGFYIHRFDQQLPFPVSASVSVQTYTSISGGLNSDEGGVFLAPMPYETFKQAHAAEASVFKLVPYDIELQDGEAVTITERYIP